MRTLSRAVKNRSAPSAQEMREDTDPMPATTSHWFRVSWAPPTDGAGTIKGSVFNDSQYRVTDVRLQIEGLDADRHLVGRRLAWAIGDIPAAGETFFAAEPLPGAVNYRITVVSWDLVSLDRAPQAP